MLKYLGDEASWHLYFQMAQGKKKGYIYAVLILPGSAKLKNEIKKKTGGIVDKNPLANARGHACDPWSRIIPHA